MSSPTSYWYWRALKKDWVLDEGTTNKFDLPERGHLSGLAIATVAVNEEDLSDYGNPYPIQRHSKFRVLGDGNFEIVNASGRQLKAIECWNDDVSPKGIYSQCDTHYQRNYLTIPFGRYMGDEKYGLILEKFEAGVEFEETNNYDTSYHEDGKSTLTIYGLFRKRPEAGLMDGGFLRKRNIIDKLTAAETEYGVKIPSRNKLRQIYLFSENAVAADGTETGNAWDVAKTIWLTAKSKEELIIDNARLRTFSYWMHHHFGRLFHTRVIVKTGAGGDAYVDSMLYRSHEVGQIAEEAAATDEFLMTTGGDTRVKRNYMMAGGSETAGRMGEAYFTGIMLHGMTPLLVIDPKAEEDDYLDADEMKDIYFAATEGTSDDHWRLVLDEVQKTYPL